MLGGIGGCTGRKYHTAVCIDLANCEPKSCAHKYNYVVLLPIQPVKKSLPHNYIHVHSFLVHVLQHQCKQLYSWKN